MDPIPRGYLDGLAEFATGLRDWSEWPSWFAMRARRLVAAVERDRFRRLKQAPREGVYDVLAQEGITVRAPPPVPVAEMVPVTEVEYEVYTGVCRQNNLFLFGNPGTLFVDQTDRDRVHPHSSGRLVFDDCLREYRRDPPDPKWGYGERIGEWLERCPEMASQYEQRNMTRWPLEKRFEVENGYELVSHSDAFCLSRVGFSTDQGLALVFLRCSFTAGCYLVLSNEGDRWTCLKSSAIWIS